MKKILLALIVIGMAASPALAQKVTIDYAHDYDFDSVKTFQYVSPEESNSPNSMMDDRISGMIKKSLIDGGLTEASEDPDIFITYHLTTEDRKSYTTTSSGYGGYYGGWGRWGYPYGTGGIASSTTSERTFTEGTLIIDAYAGDEKKLVWQGTGTVTVKSDPSKRAKQVEKILKKLGNRWQKILAGKGK